MTPAPAPRTLGPVTVTDFVRYQGASGDMNPIHHDTEFAQRAGFPTPFAVGMWPAGLLAAYATDWLGPENLRSFRIRFAEQIWPGDVLRLEVESIESVTAEDGTPSIEIALVCRRQTGGVGVRAWARFLADDVKEKL